MSTATPSDFSFPGEPYEVQQELMAAIYDSIENRQIGIFESPTGTGKTLSIICASLTWLTTHRYTTDTPLQQESNPDELAWVLEQTQSREQQHVHDELFRRKETYRQRLQNVNHRPATLKAKRNVCGRGREERDQSSDAILFSDDEGDAPMLVPREQRKVKSKRIIFATRTHSQLTQFMEELRKTRFCPPDVKNAVRETTRFGGKGMHLSFELPLSVMPFGSRKQFCINEQVRSLESSTAISERCRELTETPVETTSAKRKRSRNRCEYKNADSESILRDKALVQMYSIEEMTLAGKKLGACPYFATRAALETGDVDVIGVPYSAVLHAPTRKSLGLEIDEETIVIFDEAHNIVNTVCDLYSSVLTRPALEQARVALKAYMASYETRFSPSNLFRLRQLIALSDGFLSLLPPQNTTDKSKLPKPKVILPSAMLFAAGVDNINLFSLVTFMKDSNLSKKLRGFVDTAQHLANTSALPNVSKPAHINTLTNEARRAKQSVASFENFIRSIADCPRYGRIAMYPYRSTGLSKSSSTERPLDMTARLKYFVTEPGHLFESNVGRARATLLLGGTLSPRSAIKSALFENANGKTVKELECGHVVPADHVLTRVCETGPTGERLEFTYRRRQAGYGSGEVGRAVEMLAKEVNGGVVVFFTSYELLKSSKEGWKRDGTWGRLNEMKGIYSEERGENQAFEEYRKGVERDEKRGGVLLAVMGGKLSEGINFSDALGRAVVMVGMPFANVMDVETGEMLKQYGNSQQRGEFLENGCMTVVNQCIGRAVRHKRDFACVLLMDCRYGRKRVVGKLPGFVRRDFAVRQEFGEVIGDVRAFFDRRKEAIDVVE